MTRDLCHRVHTLQEAVTCQVTSKLAMPTYKLTYFPARGRAELARILFHYTGTQFEDIRVKGEEWQALKASKQHVTTNNLEGVVQRSLQCVQLL